MDAPADTTATAPDRPPPFDHAVDDEPDDESAARPRSVLAASAPEPEPEPRPVGDTPFWRWAGDRLTSLSTTGVVRLFIDVAAVGLACVFVFSQLHPDLILAANTPTGGDMGAHVLGPAYLRDHLLPEGSLTGWSPDWYAGFPLYHYYMVVPGLAIVALNTGLHGWAALLPLAAALAVGGLAGLVPSQRRRRWLVAAAVAIAVLGVGMPYGVAFKVVAVLGPVALPVACYAFGRLSRLPFPSPALLAGAALLFLVNTEPNANDGNTGNIIGGNLTSTMAGEFSFSLSLALMVLYFGLLIRGLRTGRYRSSAAIVLALCGLCHLIPAIYAVVGTAVTLLVGPPTRARLRWVAAVGVVAGLLGAFWTVPFVLRRAYLNDMGWEKLPLEGSDLTVRDFLVPPSLYWVVALAAVGVVLSLFWRRRAGLLLAGCAVAAAAAFVVLPEYRLWNARVLPLWYLALFLLAAIGLAEFSRAVAVLVAPNPERPIPVLREVVGAVGFLCALAIAGVHLGSLPGGADTADGGYRWWWFSVSAEDRSSARGWAEWNFSGYEGKAAYPEYYDMVTSMERVGAEEGCGRSLWEYGEHLGQYGTPMAPMLLPYWSDSCIGSMEGLFFESSATTPYHFMTQSAVSASGSRAQRDLPYTGFDLDLGVQQMQLLGIDYYLAFEVATVAAADAHPDLEPITTSGPWHFYRVRDGGVVVPLANEPAVVTGVESQDRWIAATENWYQDPTQWDVFLADAGPDEWQRIQPGGSPRPRAAGSVSVTNVELGGDRVSFDVSEPGVPVLVKVSYFPNWRVEGADGPYRVSPDFMVVIPTDTHVELRYASTPVDLLAYLLTLVGLAAVALMARADAAVVLATRRKPASVARTDRNSGDTGDETPIRSP